MRELGTDGERPNFDCPRQVEPRRRRVQEIVGERQDGADRAVGSMPIGVVIGGLSGGFRLSLLRGERRGNEEVHMGGYGSSRGRHPQGFPVEMAERQRELDREREQRQLRAMLEMLPEPVHDACALPDEPIRAGRCYIITSAKPSKVNRDSDEPAPAKVANPAVWDLRNITAGHGEG
jgi:hypothetical protein